MVISFVFIIIFVIALLFILAVGGFVVFNVFRTMSGTSRSIVQHQGESGLDGKRRALEIVAKRPPHDAAIKCGKCGATVDSTAELSADGKVRCNYCNEWSSIL